VSWSTAIIAALLSLPAPAESEFTSARAVRVEMIGRVAIEVTAPAWSGWSHQQRAALLLAKIAAESGNLSLAVHDGSKRSDGGESICLGQIHWGPGYVRRVRLGRHFIHHAQANGETVKEGEGESCLSKIF